MSLDPLNVGRLKTCGENLVIAFPWVLALDALFQQTDRKYNPYISHF